MTKVEKLSNKLYDQARYYNALSSAYSDMADDLVRISHDMEAEDE